MSTSEPPAPLVPPLVEQATKASALVWVGVGGRPARPAWHVWSDGAAYVVHAHDTGSDADAEDGGGGALEQRLPGLADADTVEVVVRGDKGGRVVTWAAQVDHLEPGTAAWDAAVALLAGARLNVRDSQAQPDRWARTCGIAVLRPRPDLLESPGAFRPGSHSTPVPDSPATTVTRKPFVLGRRARRRPPL